MKTLRPIEKRPPQDPVAREEPLAGNYFVAAYPPFSQWQESGVAAMDHALEKVPPVRSPLGIYAHIPFCQKKCDYCYYLSYIGQKPEIVNRYLNTIIGELDLYDRRPAVADRGVSFAYFGGVHYQNKVTLRDYEARVQRGELPLKRAFALSDRLVREFILQLKLGRVDVEPFRAKFGIEIEDIFGGTLSKLERQGMLDVSNKGVILSREGLLCVDRLLSEFYDSKCRDLRYT